MTEFKALGKKFIKSSDVNENDKCLCHEYAGDHTAYDKVDFYRQVILEAAEELCKRCPKRFRNVHTEEDEKICCWCGLAKKLRISAGVE